MTEKEILNLTEHHLLELSKTGLISGRMNISKKASDCTPVELQQHMIWMCGQIKNMLTFTNEKDKASRWLGFIQGTMFMLGFYTIDELRHLGSKMEIP